MASTSHGQSTATPTELEPPLPIRSRLLARLIASIQELKNYVLSTLYTITTSSPDSTSNTDTTTPNLSLDDTNDIKIPTTFSLFSNLPPELRLKIWTYALQTPQIHPFFSKSDPSRSLQAPHPPFTHCLSRINIIMQVSRESLYTALSLRLPYYVYPTKRSRPSEEWVMKNYSNAKDNVFWIGPTGLKVGIYCSRCKRGEGKGNVLIPCACTPHLGGLALSSGLWGGLQAGGFERIVRSYLVRYGFREIFVVLNMRNLPLEGERGYATSGWEFVVPRVGAGKTEFYREFGMSWDELAKVKMDELERWKAERREERQAILDAGMNIEDVDEYGELIDLENLVVPTVRYVEVRNCDGVYLAIR